MSRISREHLSTFALSEKLRSSSEATSLPLELLFLCFKTEAHAAPISANVLLFEEDGMLVYWLGVSVPQATLFFLLVLFRSLLLCGRLVRHSLPSPTHIHRQGLGRRQARGLGSLSPFPRCSFPPGRRDLPESERYSLPETPRCMEVSRPLQGRRYTEHSQTSWH